MNSEQGPKDIKAKRDEGVLIITWADARVDRLGFRDLRLACGCAGCIHEFTREPLLDPDTVPLDITIAGMSLVGNYAIQINWSDGHDTGIYTWTRIREVANGRAE